MNTLNDNINNTKSILTYYEGSFAFQNSLIMKITLPVYFIKVLLLLLNICVILLIMDELPKLSRSSIR